MASQAFRSPKGRKLNEGIAVGQRQRTRFKALVSPARLFETGGRQEAAGIALSCKNNPWTQCPLALKISQRVPRDIWARWRDLMGEFKVEGPEIRKLLKVARKQPMPNAFSPAKADEDGCFALH